MDTTTNTQDVRTLVMTRVQQEDVLVFGKGRLSLLLRRLVRSSNKVVQVSEEAAEARADGVQRLHGNPLERIDSLVSGFQLVVYQSDLTPIRARDLAGALAIWKAYLAPGGRIFLELEKETPDVPDSTRPLEEDWDRTVRRYRRAARATGMRLTHINGFPFQSKQDVSTLSNKSVIRSIEKIERTARLLKAKDGDSAHRVMATAEAWKSRFRSHREQTSSSDELRYAPMVRHMDGQARIFGAFERN